MKVSPVVYYYASKRFSTVFKLGKGMLPASLRLGYFLSLYSPAVRFVFQCVNSNIIVVLNFPVFSYLINMAANLKDGKLIDAYEMCCWRITLGNSQTLRLRFFNFNPGMFFLWEIAIALKEMHFMKMLKVTGAEVVQFP